MDKGSDRMPEQDKREKSAFALELERVRFGRDRTQKELAEATGVSQAAVSQWLSGRTIPNVEKVQMLEHFLGLDSEHLESLITRKAIPTPASARKVTDVIAEIRPQKLTTGDIGTPEDVALVLAGHTRESVQRLKEATDRLRQVLEKSQKEMDELRKVVASELPGTAPFDKALAQMAEVSARMARDVKIFDRQSVDLGDVQKMEQRLKFVLGQSPLGQAPSRSESDDQSATIAMTVKAIRGQNIRRVSTVQTGLRSALHRWSRGSSANQDHALEELLGRLVSVVSTLQNENAEQKSQLAELRAEIDHVRGLAIVSF